MFNRKVVRTSQNLIKRPVTLTIGKVVGTSQKPTKMGRRLFIAIGRTISSNKPLFSNEYEYTRNSVFIKLTEVAIMRPPI